MRRAFCYLLLAVNSASSEIKFQSISRPQDIIFTKPFTAGVSLWRLFITWRTL